MSECMQAQGLRVEQSTGSKVGYCNGCHGPNSKGVVWNIWFGNLTARVCIDCREALIKQLKR